jgi:hypothetical protein
MLYPVAVVRRRRAGAARISSNLPEEDIVRVSRLNTFIGIFVLGLTGIAHAEEESITDLGKKLTQLRAQPPGPNERMLCPSQTSLYTGLSRPAVKDALGEPDSRGVDRRAVAQGNPGKVWTYRFTRPIPPGQQVANYPVLTFEFDDGGAAKAVTCTYAR